MKACFAVVALLLVSSVVPGESRVTPEAAKWHRESLLGETADSYVALRQVRVYPGSYYEYSDELMLVRIAKNNRAVIEEYAIERSHCRQHPDTMVWHCTYDSLPALDLGRYLSTHGARVSYAAYWPQDVSIDGDGLYIEQDGIKATILPMTAVRRQLPELGEEPRVTGVEITDSHEVSGQPLIYFFRVLSNVETIDMDWSEDLLLVEEADLERARQQLEEAAKKLR